MISVTNICKHYKKKNVLNGASFSADKGDCICIVGENGTGKSTLLSIIAGIIKADDGTIDFKDDTVIGYVPQENPLIPELSVKDNLRLWYGKDLSDVSIIDEIGLANDLNTVVSKLSGGMKKRLSIAIAMSKNPNLLLLDEPSAALDLPCKQLIREYLVTFCKKGGTVIIATHDEMELEICNKMLMLKSGVLSEISSTLRGKELIDMFIN